MSELFCGGGSPSRLALPQQITPFPCSPSPSAPGCAVTGAKGTQEVARRCLRLRADMGHFVTNLQYYLHWEVMEAAWQVGLCACLMGHGLQMTCKRDRNSAGQAKHDRLSCQKNVRVWQVRNCASHAGT